MNRILPLASHSKPISLGGESDFELGGLYVCPSRREVRAGENKSTVEPRVMQVLVVLAQADGAIVSRDTLIERCWGGRVVVEAAINSCVAKVRALADLGGEPAFEIETVPKVGYRLARLAKGDEARPEKTPAATAPPPPVPTPTAKRGGSAAWIGGAVAVLLLLIAASWFGYQLRYASRPPVEASIAVLPFVNMSGDPTRDYFSDGFTEELINDLSNNPRLRITARTSAFAFKGKNVDIRTIASALHVRSLVEGSVRESGNHIRITAQLIDATEGYHIWSHNYDRNVHDILSVEDEVARAISAVLTDKLTAPARLHPKLDPAAYRLFLQAAQEHTRVSLAGNRKAVALLTEVTKRQPEFAEGYSKLAWASFALSEFDQGHSEAHLSTSADAAQKALSLDPDNVDAKLVRAMLDLEHWNWNAASLDLQTFRRTPSNNAMVLYALRIYYNDLDFPDRAIALLRRAMTLDPLSNNVKAQLSYDLLSHRYAKEAAEIARSWLDHAPNNPQALDMLCRSYALMGRLDEARNIELQLRRWNPNDRSLLQECDFQIDVGSGNRAGARAIVDQWTTDSMFAQDIAVSYMDLNDFDKASDWLERAYERRELYFFTVAFGPAAKKYRAMAPRWKTLTQRQAFREWQTEHDRIAAELARGG